MLIAVLLSGCGSLLNDWEHLLNDVKSSINSLIGKKNEKDDQEEITEYGDISFDEFVNLLFEESITSDTLTLHFFLADPEAAGITPGPVTLGIFEATDVEENLEEINACRKQLAKYSRDKMSREQRITADILEQYLDVLELDTKMQYYYEPFKQGMGLQANLPYSLAEYTFYDEEDVEEYLILLGEVDEYFESALVWEKQKAEEGLFMSDENLDLVLKECEAFLWDGEEDFFLRESFEERLIELGTLTEEQIEEYIAKDDEILLTDFVSGYELLIEELESLRGKGTNTGGLYYFPEGKAYYEFLIKSNIGMTYKDVDELYNAVYRELYDIIMEIGDILYGPDESVLDEFLAETQDDRTPEEMLANLQEKIAEDFPDTVDNYYKVKKVSPAMEDFMNPAFYMIPPIDEYENNVIYINEKKLIEDSYNIYAVLAHEGYPGHLYQSMMYNSEGHSRLRAVMQYMGYSEGWGTYAELYSYRWMDGMSDKVKRANELSQRFDLAFSTYLDIGIHYYGWDLEDTCKLCNDLLGIDSEELVSDLYQYIISNPAGYLEYYVGYMEIQKLSRRAEEELGDDFQIKEFHRFIMEFGPAPFTVIEEYFEEWLVWQKSGDAQLQVAK